MSGDDRIFCTHCRELMPDRRCRAAVTRRRRDVPSEYGPPDLDLPRRCEFFLPISGAEDQRTGRERYPSLWAEYQAMIAERDRERRGHAQRAIARAKAVIGVNTS